MARAFLLTVLLFVVGMGEAHTEGKPALRDRCLKSIAASGQTSDTGKWIETATPLGDSGFLFQFAAPDGGHFFCQICDDSNPAIECGAMGLILNYRGKSGEAKQLPAELDTKCVYYLQREVGDRSGRLKVQHDLVKRTKVTPAHTDARWVYQMALDGEQYRCVIRKSDGNFRVEHQTGADWRVLAAGVLY